MNDKLKDLEGALIDYFTLSEDSENWEPRSEAANVMNILEAHGIIFQPPATLPDNKEVGRLVAEIDGQIEAIDLNQTIRKIHSSILEDCKRLLSKCKIAFTSQPPAISDDVVNEKLEKALQLLNEGWYIFTPAINELEKDWIERAKYFVECRMNEENDGEFKCNECNKTLIGGKNYDEHITIKCSGKAVIQKAQSNGDEK